MSFKAHLKLTLTQYALLLLLLHLLVRLHDQSSSSDEVGGLLQVLQAPCFITKPGNIAQYMYSIKEKHGCSILTPCYL